MGSPLSRYERTHRQACYGHLHPDYTFIGPAKHTCIFMTALAGGQRSGRARNTLVKLEEIAPGNSSVRGNTEQLAEEKRTSLRASPCPGQMAGGDASRPPPQGSSECRRPGPCVTRSGSFSICLVSYDHQLRDPYLRWQANQKKFAFLNSFHGLASAISLSHSGM